MWFDVRHLKYKTPILVENLHGYVLPHAGTEFTGSIISHTLRFRPMKKIKNKIIIFYYPASTEPDVEGKYYHEYYVPWQSLITILGNDYSYEGYNISQAKIPLLDLKDTLLVVSADFSHFLPFHDAIDLENKAAHALMFKELLYGQAVDDLRTFKVLFDRIPRVWQLQWVGRERSAGLNAVGYLSFLLRETPPTPTGNRKTTIDGLFVTVYDNAMVARECQGSWFSSTKKWSLQEESKLINEVIDLGETTSRLTGGLHRVKPLTHYTITYLYKDTVNPFIRGWHGILHDAFYLPDVFLENTFTNGKWITPNDKAWPVGENKFVLTETLQHLNVKAGLAGGKINRSAKNRPKKKKTIKCNRFNVIGGNRPYTLYSSRVAHYTL
jgi:hypothetical protein